MYFCSWVIIGQSSAWQCSMVKEDGFALVGDEGVEGDDRDRDRDREDDGDGDDDDDDGDGDGDDDGDGDGDGDDDRSDRCFYVDFVMKVIIC